MHETVAVPEPGTVFGLIIPQLRPTGAVSLRLTVPAKPFTAATVIVVIADTPALTAAGEVAVTVKSVTANVSIVEWDSAPLAPVIVRV